jgi:hypothetical protein
MSSPVVRIYCLVYLKGSPVRDKHSDGPVFQGVSVIEPAIEVLQFNLIISLGVNYQILIDLGFQKPLNPHALTQQTVAKRITKTGYLSTSEGLPSEARRGTRSEGGGLSPFFFFSLWKPHGFQAQGLIPWMVPFSW